MEFEACVAVIMVSLTAFWSVFVTADKASRSKRPWYSSVARLNKGRKTSVSGHKMEGLPVVPRATLMGMRTFFAGPHRCSKPETLDWDKLEEHKLLRNSYRGKYATDDVSCNLNPQN